MNDNVKIRIKAHWIEVEYEGASSYLNKDILDLIEGIATLTKTHAVPSIDDAPSGGPTNTPPSPSLLPDMTTNTIASTLDAKSGSELAISAAAKLTLVDQREKFDRKTLLAEMKEASTYYKTSFGSNLTKSIETLTKSDRLRLVAKDTYGLSAQERQRIHATLTGNG